VVLYLPHKSLATHRQFPYQASASAFTLSRHRVSGEAGGAGLGIRMIGIVLVAHGTMAVGLIAALEHVVGPQQGVSAVCIGSHDDMEERRAEILESVRACDAGAGVVVLTDMFGGTPSNLAISIMEQARIEVLAGVNLPMLVKLASLRTRPIAEAVRMAQEAGRKYITIASRILAREAS
jgi:mannose PTS system EIIA component